MKVWHKRKELPKYRERAIVYVFDDGVDVEDYCLAFFYAGNLKKWAYWEDVQKAIKFYEEFKKYDLGRTL